MKSNVNIYIALVLVIVLWFGTSFLVGKSCDPDNHGDLIGQKEEFKKLNDYVGQLEIKYETQKKLHEELEKAWSKERDQLHDKIKVISQSSFQGDNKTRITDGVDLKGKKYIFHEIHLNNGKELGPPIGYVMIYNDGHVVSKIYKHEIRVDNAVSVDSKTGRYKILTKANLVLLQAGLANRRERKKKNWEYAEYPLNIVNGTAYVDPTEKDVKKRFRLLDPHVDMGLSFSIKEDLNHHIVPNVGVSLSSYGKSKKDNSLRFIRVGAGLTKKNKFHLNFSPIQYNLGEKLKFISNTYIYPSIGYSDNQLDLGLGLSVSF